MKIFETHAHYDDEAFREDREALFDEMFANDIDTIINVGASFAGCEQSVALADSHEKICLQSVKSDWITTTRSRQKQYNSRGSADS